MDSDEDYTPRYLLRGILDAEPNRSPVARSTSAEAQRSPSSTRQSARLRSDSGRGQSSSSSTRQSAKLRSDAGAPTPQEALRRSLKQKLRESSARVSLPVGNRRTTSTVTRKSSRVSLQDDVTPRHMLRNILQTEPEVSLLFQEKAVGKEPVRPRSTSSMGSSRPSTRLSDLEFSSVTLAAADQTERGLKRKRSPRILDVTAFEKRLNQGDEAKVSLEPATPAASSSISPSSASGLSELDLSTVSTDQSVRGLSRKRPPRILNVTAFEKRLNQDIDDRPARESSSASSASTTLSGVTLSLKTPHMDARTEKKALQRKAPHHRQFTVEAFEEGLDKMQSVDGTTGGVSKAACSDDFTLNLTDGPECTTDLFNHATALYAQPSVMGTPFPITATQDKCTVLASQIQRDAGDEAEGEMSQDEQMEVECSKLIRKQSASYPPAKGEEEVSVESQPEEEDAAALSQTEDEAVGAQPEEEKPVESHTGVEVESQPEEEEVESQPEEEEEEVESQPEEEVESQPEEEVESQPEEEEVESQPDEEVESQPEEEVESQPEEDAAVSQMDEETHESQTHEVAPESLEEEEEEEAPEESQTDDEEPEAPEPQTEDEEPEAPEFQTDDESQPEEEEAESQPEEEAAVSQLEEAPEVEPESQTDEEEPEAAESQPEDQMEEEAVAESQSEEEDNGKPEASIEGTPRKLSHVAEKISHRGFRSEGGGHVPVAVDGRRDYRSMGAVPKATEAEWTGNASADEGPSERRSGPLLTGHVSGTSAQIAEDPADQEEWEDEEIDEAEERSMKTPAFIRAIRKGVVTKPQSSPVLKPGGTVAQSVQVEPSVEDAASVKPKKRTGKTAGQKKKEPPSIFTKSYCMGNFRHFAKTKVSPDVYPVLKETMEKFFDRMVEDVETYANHAKRKTIEVEDFILLLKRQGHVTDKVPVEVLIEKYLDMSARKKLIPCASSGNVVFPKSLP